MRLLRKASALFDSTLGVFAFFAAILLAFIMLSVSAEVVARYFLGHPLIWVIEVTEFALVWITFLGAAWVLKREAHVVMDIVLTRLEPGTQALVNIITSVIGVAICLVLTGYGAFVTWDLYQREQFIPTILRPPSHILFAIIPIGSFMLFIQFLRRTYGYILGRRVVPVVPDEEYSGE